VIVGFTGTREGMTGEQEGTVSQLINDLGTTQFHHGDCEGADLQAAMIAADDWGIKLVVHPPENDKLRAWCYADVLHDPKPYLDRNRDIVDACDVLLAAPKGYEEELRSGTWATIRYAQKVGKPVKIIWPNGSVLTVGVGE